MIPAGANAAAVVGQIRAMRGQTVDVSPAERDRPSGGTASVTL